MNDFNKLRLKHHGCPEKLWEILQEECRYKTAKKLPETLKNPEFTFPSLAVAEMATSDAVAKVHANMINDGDTVLDMTCGLGIDSFHLASKAGNVTAIEIDPESYRAAIHNAKALNLNNISIVEGDSVAWLDANNETFDVIFIDPARRDSAGRYFALKDCQPDVTTAFPLLLSRCDKLIIKCSPMLSIDAAKKELGVDCDIVVIGTPKECKEVVFVIDGNRSANINTETASKKAVRCVTIGHDEFLFYPDDEKDMNVEYSTPEKGGYIYEAYPAVMKGGGYRTLANRFGLYKLHPNTHLYYSEKDIAGFPGEKFNILEILPSSKQTYKDFAKKYPKINVATRNFPLSAPELVKKLKVKEGGDKMVFGVTVSDGDKLLIVTDMGVKSEANI